MTPNVWVQHLVGRMQKIHEFARHSLHTSQLRRKRDYDLRVVEHKYQPGDLMFKADSTTKVGQSRKLKSPWCGPFLVVSSRPPLYTIRGRKGDSDSVVHHDKLKLCNDRDIPTWIKRLRHALFQAESEMDESWDDLDDTIPYGVDFNVQGMFDSNQPTFDSAVLPQSLGDPSYTHTPLTQELEQGPQCDTVTALDATSNSIDEPPNLDLGEISSSDKDFSGDIVNAELSSTDDETRPSAFPSSEHTSRMEEGSRSDQDVLSLSPHSEWHETKSDCTDLDVADLMVIDEVGPDEDVGPAEEVGPDDQACGVAYGTLGPVKTHSSVGVGTSIGIYHCETDEDQAGRSGAVTVSKNRLRQCPICGMVSREKTRRHVLKKHLPWFWSGATACWDCCQQEIQASSLARRHTEEHRIGCFFDEEHLHLWCQLVSGSLHLVKYWFGLTDLEGLLQYVLDRQLHEAVTSGFSDQEQQLLVFYAQNYSADRLSHIIANPPNHVISLTNWEIMTSLLRRVGPAQQQSLLSYDKFVTYEGAWILDTVPVLPEPFVFVDSHFHLDLILKRLHFNTFLHMSSRIPPAEHNNTFYYGVANYVFAEHWDSWSVQVGAAQSVYVSFGIHPHIAARGVSQKQLEDLDHLLGNYKCVAVGEIGLDFTTRCGCKRCHTPQQCQQRMRDYQEKALLEMLQIAQRRQLPVILHCRDRGSGDAAPRVLAIIRSGFVELQYHRHCFDGSIEELREWQSLPNVVFGITGKFLKDTKTNSDAISRILPHQLILESDAPFLSPRSCCEVNHPWNLIDVALAVSQRRNIPLNILNWMANDNALRFYSIPKLRQEPASCCPRPR
ncbi:tatD [Mytilus coruscus]|uniref:TatD n=1 Tax=Mytilus coruscus TaxID=42192 RepID=A0A6J8E709_MYTCO|nr:tatD [Mytilus coruscus]